MRAVRITSGALEVVEVADPVVVPGEVVVQVERSGICGTDLHLVSSPWAIGLVPGHEVAGRVAALGAGVEGLELGQLVAVKPSDPCGTCGPCRRAGPHLCPEQWATHIGLGRSGGWADYLAAPARSCVVVPDGLDADAAALAEPYAVALHGLSLAPIAAGSAATVIGAGPIGLMVTAALASRGVAVTVIEPAEPRRRAAVTLGAAAVHASSSTLDDGSLSDTALVVECSGAEGTADEAVRLAQLGGIVVLMATSDRPVQIDAQRWLIKEIRVTPSIGYSMADFRAGLAAVEGGVISPALLQVHPLPLEQAAYGVDTLRRGGAIKLQLAPRLAMQDRHDLLVGQAATSG